MKLAGGTRAALDSLWPLGRPDAPLSSDCAASVGGGVQTGPVPSVTALVEPALLIWARESANLELIAADRKIKVPEGRVKDWEDGRTRPTIAELRRAAETYKRPLGVFFLPEPPDGFETLRDFRRIQGSDAAEWSAALHDEYRRAHAQREALLEIADLDDVEPSRDWRLRPSPTTTQESPPSARRALLNAAPLRPPDTRRARGRAPELLGRRLGADGCAGHAHAGRLGRAERRCAPSRSTSRTFP